MTNQHSPDWFAYLQRNGCRPDPGPAPRINGAKHTHHAHCGDFDVRSIMYFCNRTNLLFFEDVFCCCCFAGGFLLSYRSSTTCCSWRVEPPCHYLVLSTWDFELHMEERAYALKIRNMRNTQQLRQYRIIATTAVQPVLASAVFHA